MGFFDLFAGDHEESSERKNNRAMDTFVGDEDAEFAEDNEAEFAADHAALKLREEELDINKHRVNTGEVVLRKDVIEEEQTVNVSVGHDQVVIERKDLHRAPSNEPISGKETIRIPVTAECVDVDKHTVVTSEISARKREVQETEQVREVLHREVARVDAEGVTEVIDEENSSLH